MLDGVSHLCHTDAFCGVNGAGERSMLRVRGVEPMQRLAALAGWRARQDSNLRPSA